jgi:hypothetical protein
MARNNLSGNIYVTASSDTVAYDANGSQLWANPYDPPYGPAGASAIAVDGFGNIIVAGGNFYYTTVWYDASGNYLRTELYGGGHANAMAVDSSSNVYVTGLSKGETTGFDYATVAYDSEGVELWTARYNGPANGDDVALAIAVDSGSGNIYVTGHSYGGAAGQDYATVAYDSNGNQLWVARYHGPSNGDDGAEAIAVDNHSGNVYVTGESWEGTRYHYATVAYDANGNQLWVARYNGPANGFDESLAIAVDGSGNVYVTGFSQRGPGPGGEDGLAYATVAYDSKGNQLWVARYNGTGHGNDQAVAIAVDGSGNVYVTGTSQNEMMGPDFVTIKYSQP